MCLVMKNFLNIILEISPVIFFLLYRSEEIAILMENLIIQYGIIGYIPSLDSRAAVLGTSNRVKLSCRPAILGIDSWAP
jgi:hypothetical protein